MHTTLPKCTYASAYATVAHYSISGTPSAPSNSFLRIHDSGFPIHLRLPIAVQVPNLHFWSFPSFCRTSHTDVTCQIPHISASWTTDCRPSGRILSLVRYGDISTCPRSKRMLRIKIDFKILAFKTSAYAYFMNLVTYAALYWGL